jgi:hypothetical protein
MLGSVMLDGGFHERYVVRQGSLMWRRDVRDSVGGSERGAGALEDEVAEASAPASERAAAHKSPLRVSEPHGNGGVLGGSSGRSGAAGDDANGNGGEGTVWSSVASTIAHTSSHPTTDDVSQAASGQDASHGAATLRLHTMLESIVEAQTRTLRVGMEAQTTEHRDDTAAIRADNAATQAQITAIQVELARLRADVSLSV